MTKLIFLGSAGSSSVLSRGGHNAGGLIIQFEGVQFHLDPGPGALFAAQQCSINPKHTTVFLASSNDMMKTHDLGLMIDAATHSGLERRGLLVAASSVINGDQDSDPSLRIAQKDRLDKLVVLKPGNKVGISLCEIHPVSVDSTDGLAVGFKLFFPKFTLGYIGRTAYSDELAAELKDCDMLIFDIPDSENLSFQSENGTTVSAKQLDLAGAQSLLMLARPKLAILNGFDTGALKYDPIVMCRELGEATGIQCIAAKKGLILNSNALLSHSPVKGF